MRGTNLLGLSIAAEKLGFQARGVRAQWENLLGEANLPTIAHVINDQGLGHFVVVYQATEKGVLVADPAVGIEKWSKEKFLERWRTHHSKEDGETFGALLLLAPTSAMYQSQELRKASRWEKLWAVLRPRLPLVSEVFLCALIVTLLGLGISFLMQVLMDSVFVHQQVSMLHMLMIGMSLLFLFRTAIGNLRQYLLIHLAQKIDLELILQYYGHILRMPVSFFRTRQVGEVLSRMQDASKVRNLVQGTTLALFLDLFMFLLASAVMFYYNANLTLMVLAFLPVFAISIFLLNKPIQTIQRRSMEQSAELESHLVESISGITTVKSFAAESVIRHKTEEKFVKVMKTGFKSSLISMVAGTWGGLLSTFAGLFILWYGGNQVLEGTLSLGQLMFFNSMVGYLLGPMQGIAEMTVSIQDALIAFDRLNETLDLDPEQKPDVKGFSPKEVHGEFVIENMTFSYAHRDPVLKNISLRIPAGKTVALVGESGCGKTTLSNLLARFDNPSSGEILLDGVNLRDWDVHALRRQMGIVPQDTFLFRGKIRENIALGKPDASFEEIMESAKRANIHEFISQLPERYETQIGERGVDLSGGQRQRLSIARALLHNPKILILDEATSNLDSETESAILNTLDEVKKGRTTVLIAHRLSTVMKADLIVVFQKGEIAELGTHEELIQKGGRYFMMWWQQQPTGEGAMFGALNPTGSLDAPVQDPEWLLEQK